MLSSAIETTGSYLLLHCLAPSFPNLWGPTLAVSKQQIIHTMLSAVPAAVSVHTSAADGSSHQGRRV